MKKLLLIIATAILLILGLSFAYLSLVGMDDGIEASSTGNVIVLSDQKLAKTFQGQFQPFDGITVEYESFLYGTPSNQDKLLLSLKMTGSHNRKLFDRPDYYVGSSEEFKQKLKEVLIKETGDPNLTIEILNLSYLTYD
ncbi:MAG: hypothetical protein COA78_08040 [Blastopirellula sp.]|nr:MAG: hypothetical protein COA78_08040 [Blastopirellula sp.]